MNSKTKTVTIKKSVSAGLLGLLKVYVSMIAALVLLTMLANGLNLLVPKIISRAIDSYVKEGIVPQSLFLEFFFAGVFIFTLTYLQGMMQTYASERVAKDLRTKLVAKISVQNYAYIEHITPAKLLTNLTSDVDAVKMFVAQAISSLISSVFLIIGASILLVMINWKLGLAVLGIVPIIAILFYSVFGKVRKLFKKSQEAIDWLNKVISESILGAALIRILNSQYFEHQKFVTANTRAKDLGFRILNLFAGLIPVIMFATNLATLIILLFGGHLIITGDMSLGDFSAFNNYLLILIFPVLIIGIMSNVIAQANASYQRLEEILNAAEKKETGSDTSRLSGDISVKNISISYGEKMALKDISFEVKAGTRTAVIGPTAAGKTQLLYVLTGLLEPASGKVFYDGKEISSYNKEALHGQIGFVFQDSIIFNLTVRENIAFSGAVTDKFLEKAVNTAELGDLIDALPEKLDTVISERGTNLSGGQKQRIMLARALAIAPKILLLDDFTARVDALTEKKILENVRKNYPGITLVSVTQKIASIEDYDQIILLMEGEILAAGTHRALLESCPEYVQIYNSQQSTEHYELRA